MNYNLNASEEEVIRDLVKGKGWNFLKKIDWQGKECEDTWWNTYNNGWHDIWNQYLLNLGELYDKLSDVRYVYTPTDENFKSKAHFLYDFLMKKNFIDSNVVEWSEDLKQFKNKEVDDFFERRKFEKGESCNPEIPSFGYYITPKVDVEKLFSDNAFYKIKSAKEMFYIIDTKSKYGTLRVDTSFVTDETMKLEHEIDRISEFTCERCGKQPKNSKGEHIIWQSKGYWIQQLCKKCAILDCYQDRYYDYKDTLLTGKPYYGGPSINSMMDKCWGKIKDDKMIKVEISDKNGKKIMSWYHWESFYHTDSAKYVETQEIKH